MIPGCQHRALGDERRPYRGNHSIAPRLHWPTELAADKHDISMSEEVLVPRSRAAILSGVDVPDIAPVQSAIADRQRGPSGMSAKLISCWAGAAKARATRDATSGLPQTRVRNSTTRIPPAASYFWTPDRQKILTSLRLSRCCFRSRRRRGTFCKCVPKNLDDPGSGQENRT